MTETTYTPVQEIIKEWHDTKMRGGHLDAEALAIMVDAETMNHPMILEWVRANTTVSKAEFQRAVVSRLRRERIVAELGRVPQNPSELVQAYAERDNVQVLYNGTVERSVRPFMVLDDGTKTWITDEDRAAIPEVDIHCKVHFERTTTLSSMALGIKVLNDNLKIGFRREEIADAIEFWFENAKLSRLEELILAVGTQPLKALQAETAETVWRELVEKCFDTSETSPDFVIAVLKKFMHQTKRKMAGLPVTMHLMPVILGPQGVGKSYFVHAMTAPLKETTLEVDFKMIEDDRNVEIWRSHVLFLDEMGYASKADIETIKHAITASVLTRRPMRTNLKDIVPQNATFIGCSNRELEQLIRDNTGIRRFVGIRYSSKPDWDFLNGVDWSLLWASVDAKQADPMKPFQAQLKEVQEESREIGRVEDWLRSFNPDTASAYDGNEWANLLNSRDRISTENLYSVFRRFEEDNYPGAFKTAKPQWDHEMKRLRKHSPEIVVFDKHRENTGYFYSYAGARRAVTAKVVPFRA
ncbi:hypothetical protein JNW90_13785 [Micromonospora sp. STR1s_5]|nr:hypothetical protein [Micromonospora sp. STR1s_5]